MECLSADRTELVLLKRGAGPEAVWAVHNLTAERVNLPLHRLAAAAGAEVEHWRDLLADAPLAAGAAVLDPYAVKWLQPEP
jgi:sucrose phosphorylase